MAETSVATLLELPAPPPSVMISSTSHANSSHVPSASPAATSFEGPSEDVQHQHTPSATNCVEALSLIIPPSPLLLLPCDLQYLLLTDYLPYPSVLALRSTSSHFRSLLPPPTLKRLRRNIATNLLAEERSFLQNWPLEVDVDWTGHPVTHMNCYLCLRSRPVTDFFLRQVIHERDLGKKYASRRWCKPCGLSYGKIGHGRWMREVGSRPLSLTLNLSRTPTEDNYNHCEKCPPTATYDDDEVWWGCTGCFEKEEERLQNEPRERWRNLRASCTRVDNGVTTLVKPKNLRNFARDLRLCTRDALVDGAFEFYRWTTKESLLRKACRTCGKMGQVMDPRRMHQAGQRLGKKAKRTVGAVVGSAKKTSKREEASSAEDVEPSTTHTMAGGITCSDGTGAPDGPDASPVDIEPDPTRLTAAPGPAPAPASPPEGPRTNKDVCLPAPRHEIRCWKCWRPRASRHRFRYDYSLVSQGPLPKERWCDGCLMDHETFIASESERKKKQLPVYAALGDDMDQRELERENTRESDADSTLWTMCWNH